MSRFPAGGGDAAVGLAGAMPHLAAAAAGRRSEVGLACAGGVVEGAFYEVGVLCALQEAIEGVDLRRLGVYVGVSSGALITACLANGISPHTLSRAIVSRADPSLNLRPEVLFTPATGEYVRRLGRIPDTVGKALLHHLRHPLDISAFGSLLELGALVPAGVFDSRPIERFLARAFAEEGRTNDFRELDAKLRTVAVDLDTSEPVAFGAAGRAHVPISKAVQASTALPGFYCPVEIDGRSYIDGVARRTLNASLALDEGAELLFCVNPIVPVRLDGYGPERGRELVRHGLPSVLSQTFRMLVHSRMRTGFKYYEHAYPGADVILIEPELGEMNLFFSNIFSFRNRRYVCEHAYAATRRHLLARADELDATLGRHGSRLRREVLREPRRLFDHGKDDVAEGVPVTKSARGVLQRLDRVLEELAPTG